MKILIIARGLDESIYQSLSRFFNLTRIQSISEITGVDRGPFEVVVVYVNTYVDTASLVSLKKMLSSIPLIFIADKPDVNLMQIALDVKAWAYYSLSAPIARLLNLVHNAILARNTSRGDGKRIVLFPSEDVRFSYTSNCESPNYHSKVIAYLNNNLDNKITGLELAKKIGVDYKTLLRRFKNDQGIGLRDYVNEVRISKAVKLLVTSKLSISQIAQKVGFCDTAHFTKSFKKVVGKSPQRYRKGVENMFKRTEASVAQLQ